MWNVECYLVRNISYIYIGLTGENQILCICWVTVAMLDSRLSLYLSLSPRVTHKHAPTLHLISDTIGNTSRHHGYQYTNPND